MSFILHEHLINDFYVFMLMHNYIIGKLYLLEQWKPCRLRCQSQWVGLSALFLGICLLELLMDFSGDLIKC